MTLSLRMVTADDDLAAICKQMQPGVWAKDNEMTSYQPEHLKALVQDDKNLLLLAYDDEKIAGAALCYELPHPAGDHSLYVHELDTHPDYRRHGVATALMGELMKVARARDLKELWVGTETENKAARSLYASLQPYETEAAVIYSYKVE
jgi:ribosomal protein S18 acetylase RimI-like enzyme